MNLYKITIYILIFLVLGIAIYLFLPDNDPSITGLVINEGASETLAEVQYGDPFSHTKEDHWDHMPIFYDLKSCESTFKGKMKEDIINSFLFITNRTDGAVTFEEAQEEADITFICDIGAVETKRERIDYLSITEAEAEPWTYPENNIFQPGEIYIYASYSCLGKRPTLIIHEVLHMLGLEHNVNPSYVWDVMQPYLSDKCDLEILDKDVQYLKDIYSIDPIA